MSTISLSLTAVKNWLFAVGVVGVVKISDGNDGGGIFLPIKLFPNECLLAVDGWRFKPIT